jgi:GyrI-like small molecule binding domain
VPGKPVRFGADFRVRETAASERTYASTNSKGRTRGVGQGPAVGKVWDFLRSRPGLRTDGHNIFLYYQSRPDLPIQCDFDVEVTRSFERAGEVYATETPAGEAAVAVLRGPYSSVNEAYVAIGNWIAAHGLESTGYTWEIYGDPTPDPAETETTVVRLLK